MRILCVDPGNSTGLVVLETLGYGPGMTANWTRDRPNALFFLTVVREHNPNVVAVEDFVLYEGQAHAGLSLYTDRLIGIIEAVCSLVIPPIPVVLIPAAKKNRWPAARLDKKFPAWRSCNTKHEKDALRIGLAYLEKEEIWSPK